MHDRQGTRREPVRSDTVDTIRIEDVIPADFLNDTRVDREYLEQVFREPQKFVPPRAQDEPEPQPEELEPEQQTESRLARRAKLGGLLVAASLVTGSVIAAASLAGHRQQQNVPTVVEPAGAAALGGFAVPDPVSGGQGASGAPRQAKPGAGSPAVVQAAETPAATTDRTGGAPDAAKPQVAVAGAPAQKLDIVKKFYEMIDFNPAGALSLLDPLLAGSEPGDLVRAWSSMDALKVLEATVQPDGSVIAVVTMREPDGGRLRVTQLLRMAETAGGLISEVKLLSAQQM
ncbi:hypothetical protein SAMN05421504_106317 [Amycolatopsis xylanica]|uniref:Uncharacterized protein n=1 Tax=Amycolatopsis xylanica TaxID=589385 RepID=A0A1H3LS36_9PSEU|nr:hypothetical protein [Amycolatopsis xylanica]SDY66788.1 hypothetical protein SAMN05421504_106317 [Amycolatopsis xylanica]